MCMSLVVIRLTINFHLLYYTIVLSYNLKKFNYLLKYMLFLYLNNPLSLLKEWIHIGSDASVKDKKKLWEHNSYSYVNNYYTFRNAEIDKFVDKISYHYLCNIFFFLIELYISIPCAHMNKTKFPELPFTSLTPAIICTSMSYII